MGDWEDGDAPEEGDIFDLEEKEGAEAFIPGSEMGFPAAALNQSSPVYRVKLPYSNENFLAAHSGENLAAGAHVIVFTRYGRDLARVVGRIRGKTPKVSELAWVDRVAEPEDLEKDMANRDVEKEAFKICKEKIEKHRLAMKLILAHCVLEEPKMLFFFTSDSRVDFRELVKDLVGVFKLRIELRQIGVRDEARILGGLSVCGRGYCCHLIHNKLKPVSIKMAKHQKLSLNSMKISGPCGRLLCCLFYEHGFYSEMRALPQEGASVRYKNGEWKVAEVNYGDQTLKLSAPDGKSVTLPSSQVEKKDGAWRVTKKGEIGCGCKKSCDQCWA